MRGDRRNRRTAGSASLGGGGGTYSQVPAASERGGLQLPRLFVRGGLSEGVRDAESEVADEHAAQVRVLSADRHTQGSRVVRRGESDGRVTPQRPHNAGYRRRAAATAEGPRAMPEILGGY